MNKQIDISGVKLVTPRLVLRPFNEGDLQDLYQYASVDGVGQMAGWLPHKDMDESKQILDMFINEKSTFALVYGNKVIGSLGVDQYNREEWPELDNMYGREIGYVLCKDYWGQGLMPEAVNAVVKYLFETEQLDFVTVGHFEWNNRSQRVIAKCGFDYIKTVPYQTRYNTTETTKLYIKYNSYKHRNK